MMFTGDMERASRTVKVSGERLAALWRESSMSQETFAHEIGMKRSGFLRLMQPGEHGMFTDNFRRLAEAVQTTPDDLRMRIGPAGKNELELVVAGGASPRVRGAAIQWRECRESRSRSAKSPDITESVPACAMSV